MTNTLKNSLHVDERIETGRKVSHLRKQGKTIANIFGEGEKSVSVSLSKSDLLRYLKLSGETSLVYLQFADSKNEIPVLIEEIQQDSITGEPIHVSFKRVNLKEKIQSEVPVEMIGEVNIPGATVFLTKDAVEVEALPADLPEKIIFDISALTEIGQSLHLSDAQYDREKVLVILAEEEAESPFVIVQEVKEEVEEAPEEETAEGESAPAEGDGEAASEESVAE